MKRTLEVFLLILAGVMVVAGLQGVIGGADIVLGGNEHSTGVDSEFRFFGAWYFAVGVVLLRAVSRVESAAFEVRLVAAGYLLAALGRAASIADEGSPHGYYVALMLIEFAIPLAIVPWQLAVARGSSYRSPSE